MHRGILPERDYTVRVSRASLVAKAGSVAIDFSGSVRAGIRTRRKSMKNIGLLTLLITATLLLTLAFPVAASGPKSPAVPVVAAAASPVAAAPTPAPPHPRVEHALEALRNAREHMMHAEGEFHGHRAKAIEHIDAAIHEAEICLQEP